MPSDTTGGRDRPVMCRPITSPAVFDLLSLTHRITQFDLIYTRRTILNFVFKNASERVRDLNKIELYYQIRVVELHTLNWGSYLTFNRL